MSWTGWEEEKKYSDYSTVAARCGISAVFQKEIATLPRMECGATWSYGT